MITSDCPQQQAFIQKLNKLLELQKECDFAFSNDSFDNFQEYYIYLVNGWCPTFKEYKGAHIVEENI